MTPPQQSSGPWKGMAAFALVNGIAGIPLLGAILRRVSGWGTAALYGGGFLGLAVVILGLILPLMLFVAWFFVCIQLWRTRRVGLLMLRSLCALNLAVSLVVLTRMWVNWDSFGRWAATSAPDPLNALLEYRNWIILMVALVVVYLGALVYSAFAFHQARTAGTSSLS